MITQTPPSFAVIKSSTILFCYTTLLNVETSICSTQIAPIAQSCNSDLGPFISEVTFSFIYLRLPPAAFHNVQLVDGIPYWGSFIPPALGKAIHTQKSEILNIENILKSARNTKQIGKEPPVLILH